MTKKLKEFSKMNKKEMDKFKNDLKKEIMKEYTTYFNKKYKPSNNTLNLIQSYYTKPLNLKKPMNLKNVIDDKKKIQSNDNNLLKRINFNFDFDKPKFINNNYDNNTIDVINIKTCIIYEFLLKITKVLKLDRNIRVMIPVTFRPIGNINNNVSAYILDIDMYPNGEKINFKDFNKYLEEQYYQIIAGEYFSKLNTFLVS